MQFARNQFGVLPACTENNRSFIANVFHPSVYDELVALRHKNFAFQVLDVVLDAVEAHFGQVDIGANTDAPNGDKFSNLHRGLDVQAMRGVLENFQNIGTVGAFGRSRQSQRKARLEIGKYFLICLRRGVMCFIHNQVVKTFRKEKFQIQRNTLDAAANNLCVGLLAIFHIQSHRGFRPNISEGFSSLRNEVFRVREIEYTPTNRLCVRYRCHGFAGSCGVIQQRDSLVSGTHCRKIRQCLLLMLLQGERTAALRRKIIRNSAKQGMVAQENSQLILHTLRLNLHHSHRPAINRPAQVHHAVLLRQVIVMLFLRNMTGKMTGIIINLDGNALTAIF